jgi:glycerol kinase
LGAAYLAGLAVGFWKSRNEIATLWSAGRVFRPAAPSAAMRRLHAGWQQAVVRSKSRR